MKATIDREGCIACGICWSSCSEVFREAEDGLAEVHVEIIPEAFEASAIEASNSCPVSVITVE